MASAEGLIDYIAAGPSPFHCVAETALRLEAAGFVRMDDAAAPAPIAPGAGGYLARAGSLVAWRAGSVAPAAAGFRIIGAHTDSPNLRLKPAPEYVAEGYVQWGIEPYGGVLLATWADRDLGLCGRVALRGPAGLETRLLRVQRPVCRVPNLAIHLNRQVNDDGLVLNKQTHLPPIVACADAEGDSARLGRLLSAELDCDVDAILSWDLMLFDVQAPTIGGIDGDFVFAPRIDNQASCYPALEALLALDAPPAHTSVIALFDHEEVGSGSERGAAGAFLRNVLARLERDHTDRAPGGLERAAASSYMVSADMAHGVHPNFADKHDARHQPAMNGGPVIKTNVNQRYSSDAETVARFKAACADEGATVQEFVNRSDLACGSTIGPISAAELGIRSVDVGGAMLSMHSIREQCGARDIDAMARVKARILREG